MNRLTPRCSSSALQLPADRAVGDMQLFGRLTDAVQPGSGLKGAQGIERWKVVG